MTTRSIKDGPWCWLNKEVMHRIRERFEQSNKVPVALAVYAGLCEIASDEKSETFRVKIGVIKDRVGVGYKTALEYLGELEKAGIIGVQRMKIEGTNLDAPSVYTLLQVCSDCAPVSNGCAPHCSSDIPVCSSDIPVCNDRRTKSITDPSEEEEKNTEKKENQESEGAEAPSAAEAATTPSFPTASKSPRRQKPELPDPPPELIAVVGFTDSWRDFQLSRQAIGKPLNTLAANRLLPKLAQRPTDAVAALEMAIEYSWQSVEWEWFDRRRTSQVRPGPSGQRAGRYDPESHRATKRGREHPEPQLPSPRISLDD